MGTAAQGAPSGIDAPVPDGQLPTVIRLIAAGKPTQNAYIESFNGKFRDECLNDHYFNNLEHARALIAAWRRDYNETRPHSAIGRMPPAEFAARHRSRLDEGTELTIV